MTLKKFPVYSCRILILILLTYSLLCAFQSPQKEDKPFNNSTLPKDTLAACYLIEEEKNLIASGNYEEALTALEKAQTLYAKHHQWKRAIECVVQLAKLADKFEVAEPKIKYGNLGVELAQKYLPKNHALTAAAFRQKAEALMMIELWDSANYYLVRAIPILEKQKVWEELGWSEILIGYNYFHQYNLDACQKHYQKVEELLQQEVLSQIDQTEIYATLLSLRSLLYERQGDYDRAIQSTKEALKLDIQKGVHTEQDSSFVSDYFNNLGAYYFYKVDYQRSADNFIQAINAYSKASQNIAILNNIGELLRKQKKYDKSLEYLKKSLALSSSKENEVINKMEALQSLGLVYQKLGLKDSAMYYYRKATLLPTNYRKPVAWNLLGSFFNSQEQGREALTYLSIAEDTYHQDSTASQHSFFVLSSIYRQMGNVYLLNQSSDTALLFYQKALIANHATFRDSLNIESNPPLSGIYDPIYFLKAIQGKAKTLASFPDSSQKLETALATYQVLIQWADSLQVSYVTETASLDWSSGFKQNYEEAIAVAFRLYQQTQKSDYLNIAFSFSEKSKNSLLLGSLKSSEGKSVVGVPDSLLQKEKDLNIDIAFYGKSLQKAQDQKEEAKTKLYQSYLSQSRLQLVELREKLERDFPKFHALKYRGETTSIAALQFKLLDKQSAFVEYFVGDSSTFAFVITQNSTDFLQLKNPSILQKEVANFRKVLLNHRVFQQDAKTAFVDYQNKANILYQSILQPVLSSLSTDIQELILVPDGFLNAVPLEALTKTMETTAGFDFAKLPYILYDYSIQYAYSADLLLQNQMRQSEVSTNTECLAFAPSYQDGQNAIAQRGSLQRLRNATGNLVGTAREIQAIARFFDGQFDFGETATEKQFKEFAPGFGILHLAMHGVPDFDNANFNYLQFSNLERDTLEDNLLNHYEIANMDLEAQLVVLSACETGLGKYEKGEGVYSLARSFMYAGVLSVVMSLWKVSDESTSELMPYFYENLFNGQSKERALHGAKARFLAEADLEYRHPFYWSAFVLTGDATAIHSGYSSWVWYLGIGGVVFVGFGLFFWRRKI